MNDEVEPTRETPEAARETLSEQSHPASHSPADIPLQAPASAAEQTPAVPSHAVEPLEALRQRLAEAPAPLLLKDLTKGLTPKGKKAPPPPDFPTILTAEEQAGRVYRYPSGSKGAERYWSKDEKKVIREAVLAAAREPKKLNDLKKLARETVLADKAFTDAIVDELVAANELHKQSSAGNAPYAAEKPRSLDKEAISQAILAAAETPQKINDLIKAARQSTGADKALAESIIQELIQEKRLHAQSTGNNALHGKNPPPDLRKPVTEQILLAAEKPDADVKLVAKAQKATGADRTLVESILKELIESQQLHKHTVKGKELYGKEPPAHVLDVDPGKKAFEAVVKAAYKLMDAVRDVSLEEVLQRLKKSLEHRPPEAARKVDESTHKSIDRPHPTHLTPPQPVAPQTGGATKPLQDVLKEAYDELCLDVEFQDKLVEIRRLYHETQKHLPHLTVQKFHEELERLQHNRTLELQALNEVQKAREPELALHRGDRLLYFVLWR